MEYQVYHKVVDRLEEGLESEAVLRSGMRERTAVALEVGKGALFGYSDEISQAPISAIIGVKVELVGTPQPMREGTIVGTSQYMDVTPESVEK